MNQPDLFTATSVPAAPPAGVARATGATFPRARRSDPRSSHEAAADADRFSGQQAAQVLAAVRLWPLSTSHELAEVTHMDRYAIARRCPELAAAGLVRKIDPHADTKPCTVSGKRVVRWDPVWR
jgi:hypothetical protein